MLEKIKPPLFQYLGVIILNVINTFSRKSKQPSMKNLKMNSNELKL